MVTFIAAAYKETTESFVFLSCLLSQTNPNWKCVVYCDAPNEYIKNVINHFNDSRITYYENQTSTGYWGHFNREYALQNLIDTEFVIQTSIQDYYLPITVDEILRHNNAFDFIYFNCVHNHIGNVQLDTKPYVNHIDWGCFAIKTEIAKKNGIHNPTSPTCDGEFVESVFRNHNINWFKSNKILTVHN
jgi:hypothetical protein